MLVILIYLLINMKCIQQSDYLFTFAKVVVVIFSLSVVDEF